ncbi:hypothetical protein EDC01DRAFT_763382 [Geopyxis carbonaria]|nr:hypothetical protein EDC01DRAFT_763382 [Geopyxis carbonaria]
MALVLVRHMIRLDLMAKYGLALLAHPGASVCTSRARCLPLSECPTKDVLIGWGTLIRRIVEVAVHYGCGLSTPVFKYWSASGTCSQWETITPENDSSAPSFGVIEEYTSTRSEKIPLHPFALQKVAY